MGRDKTPLVKQLNTETYLFIFFFYCFVYSRCIFIGKVGSMTKNCTKKFNALCYTNEHDHCATSHWENLIGE